MGKPLSEGELSQVATESRTTGASLRPVGVAVIGCGYISGVYLDVMRRLPILNVLACADLDIERARTQAARFGLPRAVSVQELLADPEIELVVNLTVPRAHTEVALAAIRAGKSVYNEKPLAIRREDGSAILEAARVAGVRVGCAPDTFLGAGLQTCRELIDRGVIGEPVAATAFMLCRGHESWHPDPAFYYQPGAGPMLDMGPYYLTALVALLGPVRRVSGSARVSFAERQIASEPRAGDAITVRVPTHVAGLLDFHSGPLATIVTSFDVYPTGLPNLDIYGSEGSLRLPDPNTFRGPVRVRTSTSEEWADVRVTRPYDEDSRGLGVADMAHGMRSGRPHRASGELAFHVLDIMHAIHESSAKGRHKRVESTCERPSPLPEDLPLSVLDD